MDKIKSRIAVVGAGYWGKNLVRVFFGLKSLDIICEADEGRLKQIKKDYPNIHATSSYADVLKARDIDAVVIATPSQSHYQMARDALLAGKDVFVEKPLALTSEDGIELIKLAQERKKILMVGHLLEYHPAINKLKRSIGEGKLGKIQYIYSNRLNLGKVRREENILWSFAPHDISAVLLLMGEVPESVSAYGGNYLHSNIADVTVSNLTFSSGVKGHIFVSWLHPYKEQKLVVVGTKKMALFDDVEEKDKLLIFNHRINWVGGVPILEKKNAKRIDFKMEEPLLLECKHFLNCLKTRKNPKTDGRSALKVLRVLQACQESLENGGMPVPLDRRGSSDNYYAHPTSTIEQGCQIGKGTKIWHYSHVVKGARIGKDCTIGQNVFIGSKAVIGNNVKLQNNVSVYDCIKLQDDVFCGPSVVFTNVINPRSHISRKDEFKETVVQKGATLGANSTIICGNNIGAHAFVGAGSVVTKDVLDYALVYGNPAVFKGWICQCGVKINFEKKIAICSACRKKYINKKGRVSLTRKRGE